jgi:chemotaxis protein CheD
LIERGKHKIFLLPGQFCFSVKGVQLHTVLGSCVAIALWHSHMKVGGMCHFVLPGVPPAEDSSAYKTEGYYAPGAMALFERAAQTFGVSLSQCQGKVFGGANLIETDSASSCGSIGTRNTEAALSMLEERGVEVLATHVGGAGGRRVIMDLSNGDVWVRHQRTHINVINDKI